MFDKEKYLKEEKDDCDSCTRNCHKCEEYLGGRCKGCKLLKLVKTITARSIQQGNTTKAEKNVKTASITQKTKIKALNF